MKKVLSMKRVLFLLCLLLLPSLSIAADPKNDGVSPNNFAQSYSLNVCLTDDANLADRFVRCDTNGYIKVTLGTAISNAIDSIAVYPPNPSYANITTNTNTQIKSAAGYVFNITINTAGTGSTAILYNNTSCAAPAIGTFTTTAQSNITINGYYPTGLCITTAGSAAADLTIWWK